MSESTKAILFFLSGNCVGFIFMVLYQSMNSNDKYGIIIIYMIVVIFVVVIADHFLKNER